MKYIMVVRIQLLTAFPSCGLSTPSCSHEHLRPKVDTISSMYQKYACLYEFSFYLLTAFPNLTQTLDTPGQRLSQCKKKYPSSFSTYFTPVVHANDDPLCWNLKLWGNFDFFTFLF